MMTIFFGYPSPPSTLHPLSPFPYLCASLAGSYLYGFLFLNGSASAFDSWQVLFVFAQTVRGRFEESQNIGICMWYTYVCVSESVAAIRTATGTGSNLWRTQPAQARLIIPFHKESCTSFSLFFSVFYPINSIWCAATYHSPLCLPPLSHWLASSTNRFLIEFISRSSRPSWYYRYVAHIHTHIPDNASQGQRVEWREGQGRRQGTWWNHFCY